jgi:hypothetical protein
MIGLQINIGIKEWKLLPDSLIQQGQIYQHGLRRQLPPHYAQLDLLQFPPPRDELCKFPETPPYHPEHISSATNRSQPVCTAAGSRRHAIGKSFKP